jgi:hypothetical protein
VERRLHHPDQRALARRQLVAHGVGEMGDAEAAQAQLDRGPGVGQTVELAEEPQELAHPEPLG